LLTTPVVASCDERSRQTFERLGSTSFEFQISIEMERKTVPMPLMSANLTGWGWLANELRQPYMQKLDHVLRQRAAAGEKICPESDEVFRAFRLTQLENVRVVIIGQDPYATPGMATGLCFSAGVPPPGRRPYSLSRILNRVSADIGCPPIKGRDLEPWARNGVLLLNSVLTVTEYKPGSHQGLGWESFTNRAVQLLNELPDHRVVFMLWGEQAKRKSALIDRGRHRVLEAAHPRSSDFSKCEHFSTANDFLRDTDRLPVCWNILTCEPGACSASPPC
jgi:uracil-DNA glycosylase